MNEGDADGQISRVAIVKTGMVKASSRSGRKGL